MNQKAHILSLQLFVRIIFTEKQRTSPKTFWTSKVQLNFELKNGYFLFFLSPKYRTLNFGLKLYKFDSTASLLTSNVIFSLLVKYSDPSLGSLNIAPYVQAPPNYGQLHT